MRWLVRYCSEMVSHHLNSIFLIYLYVRTRRVKPLWIVCKSYTCTVIAIRSKRRSKNMPRRVLNFAVIAVQQCAGLRLDKLNCGNSIPATTAPVYLFLSSGTHASCQPGAYLASSKPVKRKLIHLRVGISRCR